MFGEGCAVFRQNRYRGRPVRTVNIPHMDSCGRSIMLNPTMTKEAVRYKPGRRGYRGTLKGRGNWGWFLLSMMTAPIAKAVNMAITIPL